MGADDAIELAYLTDGRFRCLMTAVAALHAAGSVDSGPGGTIARTSQSKPPADGLERLVWCDLFGRMQPGALVSKPSIDAYFTDLRGRLVSEGLLHRAVPARSWLPARTGSGRTRLATAREGCPYPPSPEQARMGVALYGSHALLILMPRFAKASGLLDKRSSDTVPGQDTRGIWGNDQPRV